MLVGFAQFGFGDSADGCFASRLVDRDKIAGILGGFFGKTDDRVDHRLEAAMADHDGFEHDSFGQVLGFRFDHQDGVGGAGEDEVERGFLHLVDRRVELQLTLDVADARAADRTHERDARERQGRRNGNHGEDVGIVLEIVAEHGHDDLRVVAVAVGEQRADRAVDQAGDQRLLLGRTAFTLEITTGNTTGGERLFLIIDGEREKIDARLRGLGGHDGGEKRGLAPGGEDGTVGLAGDAAGFKDELAPGPVKFFTMDFEHIVCLSWAGDPAAMSKTARGCQSDSVRRSCHGLAVSRVSRKPHASGSGWRFCACLCMQERRPGWAGVHLN